ncbi:glycosyltransferase family 25 protein [Marinobacter alexandrii]|uniref:glycosyltransferase family 25 protein n=1 Tax=Marinobacter alexandrii TaxID=2570351 RepID=UPI001109FFB2|nr:glycosyltransferase family 25 protein [Marinobacter alexandrii]
MATFPDASEAKVVVLTLRQATDRQARIKKLLDDAGIEFEFAWGVDGRKEQDPLLNMYDRRKRVRLKGSPLSQGQLGCFAGHANIWRSCAKEDRKYVILEDDVVFNPASLLSFLQIVPSLPPHFECLRLFKNKTRNHKEYEVAEAGPFKILRYTKGPMSSMGYYLTPEAARKFLASVKPVFLPVDIYMDRYWVNDVVCLGLSPDFVSHDYHFESMIGYEPKSGRRPLYIRLNRELFTLSERLRRFFYNLGLSRQFRSTKVSHYE